MIHKFAEITGVTVEELKSRKRTPEIAEARFIYWKLRHEKHGYNYSEIGRETNRSHATIAHGIRRANDLVSMRDKRAIKIWELIKDIEENKQYKLKRWYPTLPNDWKTEHDYVYYKEESLMVNKLLMTTHIINFKHLEYRDFWELIEDTSKCETGCMSFCDGPIKHHKDCVNYIEENKPKPLFITEDGVEVEKLDISDIVVDYESAIKYLGIKDTLLVFKNYDRAEKFNAQIKLQLIAEAWNKFDEFEADWENRNQLKYASMFKVEDGKIEFLGVSFVRGFLNPHTSDCSFKTKERAKQFGNQFIDLFKVAFGI